jgi:gamma-glutamyltranspeptidase/glutathione hydrolase
VGPAIELAREGFTLSEAMARYIRNAASLLRTDPATARLLLADGVAPQAGDKFRNPDLARLLEILAARNSVDSFYRGDIGRRIAEAFQTHGGLVTVEDMADYRARVAQPLELKWRGLTVCTAPLTAGGITILETLSILKALNWETRPASPEKTQARVEALRLAWQDRLQLLGDPKKAKVPVKRLLSRDYAGELAAKVDRAVKERKPLSLNIDPRPQDGTVHLSAVDGRGNMAAVTLTHGNTLGARVTVDGLGLVLGHGMSRFDPRPARPNSPGPGKRPLNNMCPTIVLRDGNAVLALGGTGGRKIPNSVFDVLVQYAGLGASMEEAIAAPRLHTEGDVKLTLETGWPSDEAEFLKMSGYTIQTGPAAVVSAVSFDPETGECIAAAR